MHHLFAGLRYLALDLDLGVDKQTERLTAWLVMLSAPVATLLLVMGVWS
jgi:succinate dehydrogenase / fumarate reductase cytochrome b subunit